MAWRALHCVCETDGLTSTTLAHKLSISLPAARGLVRSLRSKQMLKKAKDAPTLTLTQSAQQAIFHDYD